MGIEPYQELEQKLAEWVGREPKQVVVCSSGTAALHLALEAMECLKGQKVLLPEFSMIACARAVSLAEAIPRFIDCDDTLNINPELLPEFTELTALMAVHIYGRRCPMEELDWYCKDHGLYLIEDMAEAHGIPIHPQTDAACYSFYKNKIVAGEEGGCVVFKNKDHAKYARMLRSLGFTEDHDFLHIPRGHNYRMSNLHALPILKSLKTIHARLSRRAEIQEIFDRYFPSEFRMPKRDVVWVYDVRLPGINHQQQLDIVKSMNQKGVSLRCGFKPMSMQREYEGSYGRLNAYRLSQEIAYFPIKEDLTEQEIKEQAKLLLTVYSAQKLSSLR